MGYTVDAALRVADCHRVITLDFDCEKQAHIKKRVDKLQTLITELEGMKQALLEVDKNLNNKRKFFY